MELPKQKNVDFKIKYKALVEPGEFFTCSIYSRERGQETWVYCGAFSLKGTEWVSFQSHTTGIEFEERDKPL